MRVREQSESIALSDGAEAERVALDGVLDSVLANQVRLVWGHTALAASTAVLEYSGALLNFVCLAVPIFSGKQSDRCNDDHAHVCSSLH